MEGWPSLVDGNSLENCQGGNLLGSSNLPPSARIKYRLWAVILLGGGGVTCYSTLRGDSKLLPARLRAEGETI